MPDAQARNSPKITAAAGEDSGYVRRMKRFLVGVVATGVLASVGCGGTSPSGAGGAATTGSGDATVTSTGSNSTATGMGGGSTATSGETSATGTGGGSTASATSSSSGTTATSSSGTGGAPGCVIDGVVTGTEQCDDDNTVDGDGCDHDCTFSCVDPVSDCPAAPVCKQSACLASHTCGLAADPAQEGLACGANALCKAGVCAPIVCGDGVIEGAEQCDFGAANGPGAGCETTCTFSCTKAPDSCPNAETCDGVEVCTTMMSGTSVGQKCAPGVQLLDCSACASGVCGSGVCKASTCGDGCVDASKGEQCEPPGTVMCDAACKTVIVNACGDGVRGPGEQCDDGNLVNLDGCDATCKFEQDLRSNYLQMQFGPDAFCGNANRFGSAIPAGLAQSQLQTNVDQGIAAGTSGFVIKMLGLASPTGADDPALEVGAMLAVHLPGTGYDGTTDLDWWYGVSATYLDAARNPLDKLAGNITGAVLNAGPGAMNLDVNFFPSTPSTLRLANAKLQLSVGASFAPGASAGATPGHLASEHLDPALQSFGSLSQASPSFAGKLCGDITAKSLTQVVVPSELRVGGIYACIQGYTAASSFLDVVVSGCTINVGNLVPIILPTQPDHLDPAAPVIPGGGAPYTLIANAQKVVTGCNDKNNMAVPVASCVNAVAYSSYFRLAMGRVILK
jgi:cysteine-rich repeat protein